MLALAADLPSILAIDVPNTTLPQSAVAVVVAVLLLVGSRMERSNARLVISLLALGGLLAGMIALPLTTPAPMGDYHNFAEEGRAAFEERFVGSTRFQFHLAGAATGVVDAVLGRPDPAVTFDVMAAAVSALFVGGLTALGFWGRWSAQVIRYIALATLVPITVLFFGYHEFGHLPLAFIAPAIPLVLVGIDTGNYREVIAGSFMLGVGAAMHGFGLVALLYAWLLIALAWKLLGPSSTTLPAAHGMPRTLQIFGAGVVGWLGWFGAYAVVLGIDVYADHASSRVWRRTFTASFEEDNLRINYPVFSGKVITDLAFEFGIVGAAALLLVPSVSHRLRKPVLLASIPVLAFTVWFWPVGGLGGDTDNMGAMVVPFFAAAWLISSSRRLTLVGGSLLLLGHFALLRVLTTGQFVETQLR